MKKEVLAIAPVVLVDDCGAVKKNRYIGKKRPRCSGGLGCNTCWAQYASKPHDKT